MLLEHFESWQLHRMGLRFYSLLGSPTTRLPSNCTRSSSTPSSHCFDMRALHTQHALMTQHREVCRSYAVAGHHNLFGVPVGGLIPESDQSVPGRPQGHCEHPGNFCATDRHLLHELHPRPGLHQESHAAAASAGFDHLLAQVQAGHNAQAEGCGLARHPSEVWNKRKQLFSLPGRLHLLDTYALRAVHWLQCV